MTMTEIATPGTRGRQIKFTPERIDQIKNLVERGRRREEIAETIGVTVGSLQVTCSRLGISLRAPRVDNGMAQLARIKAPPSAPPQPAPDCASAARMDLLIRYRGQERQSQLPLPPDMIQRLAVEAALRGVKIADLIGEMVAHALAK